MLEKSRKTRNSKWTEEKIFAAIDLFIVDNMRLPYVKELDKKNNLPTHSSISNRFGLTVTKFYETYYKDYIYQCESTKYHYRSLDYWIDNFKTQYINLNCPTMKEYDKFHSRDTPSSRHLIYMCKLNNWNELLDLCGFKIKGQNIYSTKKTKRKNNNKKYRVTFNHSKDVTVDAIQQNNKQLNDIINNIF